MLAVRDHYVSEQLARQRITFMAADTLTEWNASTPASWPKPAGLTQARRTSVG